MSEGEAWTYAAAGVSLATAEGVVERLRAAVESTGASGFGAFAGLLPLDERRLLAASTDSIGTKLIVAARARRLRDCGADLAAHCINDVLTTGAEPLILLDYVAANRIDLDEVAELVEGAAEVCRAAGVALVGGETAELPGIYREGELDFAGTCVGVVERDDADRRLAGPGRRRRRRPAVRRCARERLHARPPGARGRGLRRRRSARADAALPRRRARARGRGQAFAHVTGGGIPGNLARVLPDGLGAELDWDAWERPPVFGWLARHVEEDELRRVFNLGIGYCAVVARPEPGELVIGRIAPDDRRARQRRGHEPAGAARRRAAGGGGGVERAGRLGARARAPRRVVDGRVPARRLRDRRRATPRWPRWLEERGVSSSSARATCTCSRRRSSTASRARSSTPTRRCCPRSRARTPIEDVLAAGVAETASPSTTSTRASTPAP